MRSRFLVCAALAGFAFAHGQSRVAHAADPKAKNAKKKGDDLAEDKSGIGKTLQWEDKVMGPDDKKSELDKIRRATRGGFAVGSVRRSPGRPRPAVRRKIGSVPI